MNANVIALRPARSGDAQKLWDEWKAAERQLEHESAQGYISTETYCRCADAYRAWCRAAAWDRLA